MKFCFIVNGEPIPKGSTRSFAVARGTGDKRRYTGQTVNMASNLAKLRPWESRVADAALQAGVEITKRPVVVACRFYFRRPKSHFRSGKNAHLLRDNAPEYHTNKPDLDKLTRALLDGLTNVAYLDDSQVCAHTHDLANGHFKVWMASPDAAPYAEVDVIRL